ncbi:endonuclease/exonuclease/phosphatase family protein [Planctomonas psychrotolerans]|uniref:endonuclease/exonuclease/phosphatase family protein n=1 Tax=Planctomonas psychrotolerans TaxID=2528712 RepID=UPI00123C0CBB|nr:endonuclease/exonuclease/phosphatase family protein [Planctomonas psychrotolerans]
MSFNVRTISSRTRAGSPDFWPSRRTAVTEVLALEQPTILGVQELLQEQLPAIESGLPASYRMLGEGREGGAKGELGAIFYDSSRLTAIDSDSYWLSDTPDVVASTTWGNRTTRMVTWARLRDRRTGSEFVVANTHLDHESESARRKSAHAIADHVRGLDADVPVIVMGDFNVSVESEPYSILTHEGGLRDAWLCAHRRATPAVGTFPNYDEPVPGGDRIDWILANEHVEVLESAINPFRWNGRYPSDHTPVQALLRVA